MKYVWHTHQWGLYGGAFTTESILLGLVQHQARRCITCGAISTRVITIQTMQAHQLNDTLPAVTEKP